MIDNRLPEKKPQFQIIRKLQKLLHFNKQAFVVLKFKNAAEGWNSLGHRRSD